MSIGDKADFGTDLGLDCMVLSIMSIKGAGLFGKPIDKATLDCEVFGCIDDDDTQKFLPIYNDIIKSLEKRRLIKRKKGRFDIPYYALTIRGFIYYKMLYRRLVK